MQHKNSGERILDRLIQTDAAFARAARIVREVSYQRLRMRNEQFGFPLTEAELISLDQRARVSTTSKRSAAEPETKSKDIYRKELKVHKKM